MKSRELQPRLLYPAKLSLRIKGQIKCFSDKVKLKEFLITQPLLDEMLKGLFKKKKMKTMHVKMAVHSQLSTIESERQTKQTSRTETKSQIWSSFGGLSAGRGKEENGEKAQGLRSTNW